MIHAPALRGCFPFGRAGAGLSFVARGVSVRYPSSMSAAISSLLGALVGGLAAIGGAWLQARNTARLQREEAARQEKRRQAESVELLQERQRLIARRYLHQLGDAVDSLRNRVDNWAHRGGYEYSKSLYPDYWEETSLYAVARALGAERILDLEGVYVELHALSSEEATKFPRPRCRGSRKRGLWFPPLPPPCSCRSGIGPDRRRVQAPDLFGISSALRRSTMEFEIASRSGTPGFQLGS